MPMLWLPKRTEIDAFIPLFRYFPNFSTSPKYRLAIEYHAHIWQVSPQLSCCDTCQIWMRFKEWNRYFCRIENFACGEIDERNFSNPHPWSTWWLQPYTGVNSQGTRQHHADFNVSTILKSLLSLPSTTVVIKQVGHLTLVDTVRDMFYYLPKFKILASMFICRDVCLCVCPFCQAWLMNALTYHHQTWPIYVLGHWFMQVTLTKIRSRN